MKVIVDRQQDIVPNTQTFSIDESHFISFTKDFKYLRSYISYHFDDIHDINLRIKKAHQAIEL